MYENADDELPLILAIVDKCPEPYRLACFEALIHGYVEAQLSKLSPLRRQSSPPPEPQSLTTQIPAQLLQRFQATARHLNLQLAQLESLFDFTLDPFTFHALTIPAANDAEKTRRVALAVAAKSYLTSGNWIADWEEVKAACIDQSCYHRNNHQTNLRATDNNLTLFKPITTGQNIELTNDGIKEAERLLASIAQATAP